MWKKVSVFVRIRCPFSTGTTVRFQRDLVSEVAGIRRRSKRKETVKVIQIIQLIFVPNLVIWIT